MELGALIGLLIGIGSLVFGYTMDSGSLKSLWLLSALIIVLGGSVGSVIIAYGLKHFLKMPGLFMKMFRKPKSRLDRTLDYLIMLAENARRDGLLSLEKILNNQDPKKPVDPLLKRGMLMVIDGADLEQIKEYLETEITIYEDRCKSEISIFDAMGGYAPAYGMIGTIMGLIQVLANMESPEQMAAAIAVAFITTLYGVVLANAILLPAGNKLRIMLGADLTEKEMIIEGICSIRNGQNPKMLKEKLSVFLDKADTKKKTPAKEGKAKISKEAANAKASR